MVPGRRSLGVLVTGILGTEPFPLFAFLLLWSPVLPCAVCFNRDILFTNASGHLGQPVWKVLELSRASPSSYCGHCVPGPGSRLRLCLVHTDLISSFSHCYRRHFMISVFLNLLRFVVYHDLFWKMTWLHLRELYLFLYCWELYLSSSSSVPHFLIDLFSDYTWLKVRYWSSCSYCRDLSLWICSCLLLRFRHAYIWCTRHNLREWTFLSGCNIHASS